MNQFIPIETIGTCSGAALLLFSTTILIVTNDVDLMIFDWLDKLGEYFDRDEEPEAAIDPDIFSLAFPPDEDSVDCSQSPTPW